MCCGINFGSVTCGNDKSVTHFAIVNMINKTFNMIVEKGKSPSERQGNFNDQHQLKVNEEFKRRLGLVRNFEEKIKLESEYGFFIKKLDSVRNQAYLGVLIKTKNLEQLSKLNKEVPQKKEVIVEKNPDHAAEYPGGIDKLREIVSSSFYFDADVDRNAVLKSIVTFVVERDGSIAQVQSEGNNSIFNRQAEIWLLPEHISYRNYWNDVNCFMRNAGDNAAGEYAGGNILYRLYRVLRYLKPLLMCAGALAWSQLSKIVIGARDEKRDLSIGPISSS
ncbi:hypothetical protein FQR65_LT18353 [Abscondita terminalis]|nr:hypothetical protein FQR65_LT18353 [Abscondita terminalis]